MNAIYALGWALVHSLWQGALAAAALASLLPMLPARAARARYALATTTLILMVALPLATALRLPVAAPWTADGESVTSVVSPLAIDPALPWVVALWLAGVVAFSARLATGWKAAQRLAKVNTRPAPKACVEALARLAARLRVTRLVTVLESAVVQVPAVIGWLRPVVLLPASALTGLTPLQLDALLAHELAHVRRHDYLLNLVQCVIEILLFYHPAVWWVSRRVRQEREHCCDDLAVAVCGDAHSYATALFVMERLRVPTPALAVAASGGSLLSRIRRLLVPTQAEAEIFPRWMAGLVTAALALTIVGGTGLAGATATPGRQAEADGATPVAALRWLEANGRGERDAQRDALEELGESRDPRAFALLGELARHHPQPKMRRKALDEYVEAAAPEAALSLLQDALANDQSPRVRAEALEELAELPGGVGIPAVIEVAQSHPNRDLRAKAWRYLDDSDDPRARDTVERAPRRP